MVSNFKTTSTPLIGASEFFVPNRSAAMSDGGLAAQFIQTNGQRERFDLL